MATITLNMSQVVSAVTDLVHDGHVTAAQSLLTLTVTPQASASLASCVHELNLTLGNDATAVMLIALRDQHAYDQ